jgi:hypothetical protein
LPGEAPAKDKTYFEKKKERDEFEGKTLEEINELMSRLHDEKRVRKEKKRKEKMDKLAERKRIDELK